MIKAGLMFTLDSLHILIYVYYLYNKNVEKHIGRAGAHTETHIYHKISSKYEMLMNLKYFDFIIISFFPSYFFL